ncbi:serine/threonine-protein kinase ULK4-like [Bolinopsis microptera]|uniref:serine/threonine-protein kinase ULK4-like n=1 Tax=Bolinopsis microptera TaxID=2820187 RepID=UPI003079F96A
MNDYILYNELGRGAHTTVYKGRKKGQIDFVAICSYEKDHQKYVHNKVSILSQTKHPNVIEFYEWYETSSHFWVIEELCNGCSLATAMTQDCPVPEPMIRACALQLCKALYHIHCAGIVVRNLHPHKIYIDSKGSLKVGGLLMGCDLSQPTDESVTPALSPLYCCPEALIENTWSYASDLWSLGAILYHMFTGKEPFPGSTLEEITEGIEAERERRKSGDKFIPLSTEPAKYITLPGTGVDGAPISDELHDLLSGLLDPDPSTRLGWRQLELHPYFTKRQDLVHASFFRDSLQSDDITDKNVSVSESNDITDTLNKTVTLTTAVEPAEIPTPTKQDTPQPHEVSISLSTFQQPDPHHGRVSGVGNLAASRGSATERQEVEKKEEREEEEEDDLTEHLTESMIQIPQIEMPPPKPPVLPRSESRKMNPVTPPSQLNLEPGVTLETLIREYQQTLLPQPIVGNPKVFKEAVSMRCDTRTLPWQPLSPRVLNDCEGAEISHHLVEIADFLSRKNSNPRELASCIGYIYNLTTNENCVYLIVNSELLLTLSYLVKSAPEEVQLKIVQVVGALVQNSTTIEPETQLGECVTILTDVLRDSSRSPSVRLYTLASLGELIFYIASQEETDGVNSNWSIPASTFVCITRCLREGEEFHTQLCAAKIVENVCSVNSQYNKQLSQDAIALSLWKLQMKQAATDSAYITYVRALTNMTAYQPTLLTHVISKIGLVNVLDNLNKSQPYIQKEILNFVIQGLTVNKPNATCKRILSDRNLLSIAITLMGNPHSLSKSFAALLISLLLVGNDALVAACNLKLIQTLDRELKRVSEDYSSKCLAYLSHALLSFIPTLLDQVEVSLKKVENRRNPNSNQLKDLNSSLSSLPTILHLLTSRPLSNQALAVVNMDQLCDILKMVPGIQSGDTGLGSPGLVEDTLSTLLSLSEICLPHMSCEQAVPTIGNLCKCQGDYRGVAVQLCMRTTERAVHVLDAAQLSTLYTQHVLPVIQEMLLETPPLPTLALRIIMPLLSVLPQLPLEEYGIVTALVELMKDVDPDEGICLLMLDTLGTFMTATNVDFSWLYTIGVHEQLSLLILKLGVSANSGEPTILAAVKCLSALLNYIMSVVKTALQTKNKSSGEEILRSSQCVVNTCGVLLVWYHYTTAPSALLSITQLYGGQYRDFLTPYNVDILVESLKDKDDNRVKTTLKILKRIISTDPVLLKSMIASTKEQLNKAVLAVKSSSPTLVPLSEEVSKLLLKPV